MTAVKMRDSPRYAGAMVVGRGSSGRKAGLGTVVHGAATVESPAASQLKAEAPVLPGTCHC